LRRLPVRRRLGGGQDRDGGGSPQAGLLVVRGDDRGRWAGARRGGPGRAGRSRRHDGRADRAAHHRGPVRPGLLPVRRRRGDRLMELATGRVVAGERHAFLHVDPILLAAAICLAVIGLFAIYSATHQSLAAVHLDHESFVKRQHTFLEVGAVVLMLALSFDYRLLKVYAGMIYVSSLVLLVLVRT